MLSATVISIVTVIFGCAAMILSCCAVIQETAQTLQFPNVLDENITVVEQADDTHFFVATEMRCRYTRVNEALHIIPFETLDNVYTQINGLYYHRQLQRLFIGTFSDGTFAYDMSTQQIIKPDTALGDVSITHIRPLE